jgi:Protein of unknown function (DUF2612)
MATNTPIEIVESYVDLLIMQYLNKVNASGTIQTLVGSAIMPQVSVQQITFVPPPNGGTFKLNYNGTDTSTLNWNDTAGTIQTALRAITGLSSITVAGAISTSLAVTFTGVNAPANMLTASVNNLTSSLGTPEIEITETDVTLPLAIQAAFNLIAGTATAVGDQLDTIGKYVGVTRTGPGFNQPITLDDADFLSLIRMAIFKNSSGSSLADIQNFLHSFFPNQIQVYDYQNMRMSYIISQAVGSQQLAQLFVTEGIIPKPMGVGLTVFYVPATNLFSFRTYEHANTNGSPFNSYANYNTTWPWLSYGYLISIGSVIFIIPVTTYFSYRTYGAPSTLAPFNDYASYQTIWPWLSYS